jgi:hypothetical protein
MGAFGYVLAWWISRYALPPTTAGADRSVNLASLALIVVVISIASLLGIWKALASSQHHLA